MKAEIRLSRALVLSIQANLRRRHHFAHERVGFLACETAAMTDGGVLILPVEYIPLGDDEYIRSKEVGAMMSHEGIGRAMQHAYRTRRSILHVHEHCHNGRPNFSRIDVREGQMFMPDFFNASPKQPHGLLVLSHDYAAGLVWRPGSASERRAGVTIVGSPMRLNGATL